MNNISLLKCVFLVKCLFSNNIYDFGLMENDMKLQHLLIKDNFLMKLYSKNNLKDKYFEKFVSSCSSIQRQGSILHPLDAFCLIKKYSKIMPKIFKPEHLIDQLMLENQTTEVFDTLPEKTYQQAISALGFLLKHLFLRCYMNKLTYSCFSFGDSCALLRIHINVSTKFQS